MTSLGAIIPLLSNSEGLGLETSRKNEAPKVIERYVLGLWRKSGASDVLSVSQLATTFLWEKKGRVFRLSLRIRMMMDNDARSRSKKKRMLELGLKMMR